MFGMNGFHVSASGAIQGHHGPLVLFHFFVFAKKQPFAVKSLKYQEIVLLDDGRL